MDEQTLDDLSAYLDGELDAAGRARVAELVATSNEARALLDRLAVGRDLARSSAMPAPTRDEAAVLDAGVLSPMPAATAGGPSGERGQDAVSQKRLSPRRRGRPPWPYFVAAAAFALVLSLGVAVLAQVFGRGTTREATAPTTAATTTAVETPASTSEGEAHATAPTSPNRPAAPRDSTVPSPETADSVVPDLGRPELYRSGVQVGDSAGLAALARSTEPARETRDEAIATLVGLAEASGTDLTDLAACLSATGPGTPVRVDVGAFDTQPAYLVVLRTPGDAGATVTALARGTCAVLATVPVPP